MTGKGILKSRLTDLNLRYNGLDASSARIIQGIIGRLSTLEKLDLRNNDIKVLFFVYSYFSVMCGANTLFIIIIYLLQQGISFIAAALEFTPSLQELLLWENGIDDRGLIFLAQGLV
jgi:Leucine-rich repeat (LRR) protein